MPHTRHAAASYASVNPPGVSPSSQARPTILQSMKGMLATWNKKQMYRNSSVHLMPIKGEASSHSKDLKDFNQFMACPRGSKLAATSQSKIHRKAALGTEYFLGVLKNCV
jgi:hypothetical protein